MTKLYALQAVAIRLLFGIPLVSILWMIDDVFFSEYKNVSIVEPVIILNSPRSGSTSFHETLSLDERFYAPTLGDLVCPFSCIHKLVSLFAYTCPGIAKRMYTSLENSLHCGELGVRHRIRLDAPEVDDFLVARWNWTTFIGLQTFPAEEYAYKHSTIIGTMKDQERCNQLLDIALKKLLHLNRNSNGQPKQLLLRSHRLEHWRDSTLAKYPDAHVIGILRDPIDVLRSFASLMEAGFAYMGLGIFDEIDKNTADRTFQEHKWSGFLVYTLNRIMGGEVDIFGPGASVKGTEVPPRGIYTVFTHFKTNPVEAIRSLYEEMGLKMTEDFELAIKLQLSAHETYKQRHQYENPTLEQMKIDKDRFLSLQNVQRYNRLLQKKLSE